MWKFLIWFSQRCFFCFLNYFLTLLFSFLFIFSQLDSCFPLLFHSMSACFPSFIPSRVTRGSVLQALHWVLMRAVTKVSAPGSLPFLTSSCAHALSWPRALTCLKNCILFSWVHFSFFFFFQLTQS